MDEMQRYITGQPTRRSPIRSSTENQGTALLALAGLALLGFLFLKQILNKSNSQPLGRYKTALPLALAAKNYTNSEEWDIEWNKDGLPQKVTIHRRASRE